MKDYRYLFTDSTKLTFEDGSFIDVQEATAIQCFEHAIYREANQDYVQDYLLNFLEEYSKDFDLSKHDPLKIYKLIVDKRFMGFFGDTEEEQKEETPFYSILAALGKIVGDPYDFIEKRTWRQTMNLLKGSIWNQRAGVKHYDPKNSKVVTYDGDKENKRMLLMDKGQTEEKIDHFDAINDLIKSKIKK